MSPTLKSRVAILAGLALAWIVGSGVLPSQTPELKWYKGNLHTHTINSDGDSSPDTVARWYKEHRYHFLALTDHNYLTDPQGLSSLLGASERFLLITGEEVTTNFRDAPVHVNAFRLSETIQPASGDSVQGTLQANVDRILAAGSIPSLNHPYYRWAIDAQVFRAVERLKLFEVFNGSPDTNDEWGLEEIWDSALTAGREVYGIAVDDAHEFKQFGPDRTNPGRGWIEVSAAELSQEAILDAVERGDFYASTGIKLAELTRGKNVIDLRIEATGDEKYLTRFIGRDGKELDRVVGLRAAYRLRQGDGYARASIRDSAGRRAWVQPVFGP